MTEKLKFQIFQKLLRFVQTYAKTTVLVFVAGFFVFAWGLKYLRLELDIYDVYDPGFRSSVDVAEFKEAYGDKSQILLAFEFKTDPKAGELCKLLRWTADLNRFKDIKSITSLWSIRSPQVKGDKLWYPKKLTDPCEADPEQKLYFKDVFSGSYFGHYMSQKDDKNFVFDVAFSGGESNTSQVEFVMKETDKFLKADLPEVKVSYLGMSASRYYFKKIIVKDSIFTLLIILILVGLLRLFYGTWRSGIYLTLTLIGSTLFLYGAMALVDVPVNILTNNLFLMTAVAGTADFIFVTHNQFHADYQESYVRLIVPCFFTTLTTVVGFLSLNTSDLLIIRQFGNGAALGALAEWVMLFMFMPALLKVIGKEKIWVNSEKALSLKWLELLEKLSLPKGSLWAIHLLMVLSVPAFFFLNDYDSPVKNLPFGHVMRSGYEDFKDRYHWEGQAYLYFPERPTAPRLKEILEGVKASPDVYKIENPEALAAEWTEGLPSLRQDLIRRELSLTPLWERYYSKNNHLRIPMYLYEQDLHTLKELRDHIEKHCKGDCRLAGQRVVYLEYGEKISRTMIESFVVSILLVVLILLWLLKVEGKLQYAIPVIMSSLMGPLVILTFMAIFQVPVTLVTSIFLAVMVGLAGDNAIQYLMASDGDLSLGIDARSKASIVITLVMVAGSALFVFQSLLPMKILGMLFISGFIVNLIGDFWGLKSLLNGKA